MAKSPAGRSSDEIKASIEQNRVQLSSSIDKLRGEVTELTDWRAHVRRNQKQLLGAAAVTGFVLAGGIGSIVGTVLKQGKRLFKK